VVKILTIVDWYLPGFKAGGPIRSVSNLISALGTEDCDFYVITRDRDLKDSQPYPGVPLDSWTKVGQGNVLYMRRHSLAKLRRRINEVRPDVIYMNSFFSRLTIKVLLLRRLGLVPPCAMVVAPRGEFSPGALALKKTKKQLFMAMASLTGLYRKILWHASAEREKQEMEKVFSRHSLGTGGKIGIAAPIHVASDFPEYKPTGNPEANRSGKKSGEARFVFVSRVSPMKNLAFAIDLLCRLKGNITFDIYGPAEDVRYFEQCRRAMAQAPEGVTIRYMGPLEHEDAQSKFLAYHFFLFPTRGENFGHVIVEALAAGCPAIISDQTPWVDLERQEVGWNLALTDPARWQQVLQSCVDMDGAAYSEMSRRATQFLKEWVQSPRIRQQNVELFRHSLAMNSAKKDEEVTSSR
jgi:glycosyltransferase involved in cell wall biosynthesis